MSAASTGSVSPAAWRALATLTIINLFCYMDRMALAILMEPIKAELGLSDGQLGLLTGLAFALFYCTMGLPLAWLADRAPRVKLLAVCLVAWSAFTSLSGMARSFPLLFLARMGVGVGEAGCIPTAHSLISDYFPRERRGLAVSIFQTGSALGVSGGLMFVGMLAHNYGWRASLIIVGLAGVPVALLALVTIREPARPLTGNAPKESMVSSFGALLRRPALIHLTLALSLSSICTYGITQWMPSFLIRSYGLNIAQAGAWLGAATLVSGIVGLLTGGAMSAMLVKRDPRWELWIPAIGYGISLPLYVLLFFSPTVLMVLVLKVAANFFAGMGSGVLLAAAHSFAESNRRAAAIALVLFASSLLGMGAGPYLIGLASDLLQPSYGAESLRYALLLSCVGLVLGVVHCLLAARRSAKDRVN
jgi:MFS family permease